MPDVAKVGALEELIEMYMITKIQCNAYINMLYSHINELENRLDKTKTLSKKLQIRKEIGTLLKFQTYVKNVNLAASQNMEVFQNRLQSMLNEI